MPKNHREQTDDWDDTRNAFGGEDDWENLRDGTAEKNEEIYSEDPVPEVPGGPADLSLDDDGAEEQEFYTLRRESYQIGDKVFSSGDTVPVHCQHCAFWEREIPLIGNKKLCFSGRESKSDGTIYSADKFSCGTFFIPRDLPDLDRFFDLNIDELEALRRFFTLAARTEESKEMIRSKYLERLSKLDSSIEESKEKIRSKYRTWAEKNNVVSDVDKTLTLAEEYMFGMSQEALRFSKQFFVKYVSMQLKRRKKSASDQTNFRTGDWVYWIDAQSKDKLYGLILGIGRGKIKLAGAGESNKGTGYDFHFKDWKVRCKPEIHIKTVGESENATE